MTDRSPFSSDDGRPSSNASWLIGGGEMGKLIRSMDWSKTPLGPIEDWPQSLRTTVSLCLGSNFPISMAWGPHHIQIYNDGYWPICGGKHPGSMGQDFSECWASAMPVIGDAFRGALGGKTSYLENQRMFLDRHGYLEETFFTFSFSPIRDESGGVGGLFHPVTETTSKMLGERRTRAVRDLAARAGKETSPDDVFHAATRTLAEYELDLPFTLIYRIDDGAAHASLVAASGLSPGGPASPEGLALASADPRAWPLAEVIRTGSAVQVDDVPGRIASLACEPYPEPPKTAILLPITPPGVESPLAVIVAGVSSRLVLNEMYRSFYELLASAITAAVANARAHEEERKRAEALAELDRAKTTFFSNVSHEFRTPLTLMLGPLEDTLGDAHDPVPDGHRERLLIAHRNSLRLLKLVNSLLDFSRIEAGRIEASYEPVDLAALTAELASNFRSACERAGVRLDVDCRPLPEPVYVDRDMWEKIVLNLVSNAFKFTLEGTIAVTLDATKDRVELAVRDTGVGIPADELPRLFERFHRVEGAGGRTQEGTGIGLALVQELIKLHGGEVRAESEPGAGTTFFVALPFGKAHLPADRIGAVRSLTPSSAGAARFVEEALRWVVDDGGGGVEAPTPPLPDSGLAAERDASTRQVERSRILVADDNADMRDYLRRLLSQRHDVQVVADGRSALEAARSTRPDLVLTDVMMPGLDGFALLAELRADAATREAPVILVSARAGEEARVEGLEAGADDYVTKPFSARELLARVDAHLALATLRRQAAERLRESEARFRNMADSAPVIIWVTDSTGACTYLNKGWCDFTGTTVEQGQGGGWLDSVHPDDRAATEAAFVEANARQEEFRLEYRLRRHDGAYRWTIDSAAPRFGPDGQFAGYIGSVTEIHERKQAEESLRGADRRKDEFLATLAHELRNPLAPIYNGLELLKVEREPARLDEIRETMERQTRQLVSLVDDLLDVSRITRGKLELRRARTGLADVVQTAVDSVRPEIQRKKHAFTVDLPAQATEIDADPHRFAQIVSNLLSNAVKYTPEEGEIALTIETEAHDLVVSVRDSGIGIPSDMRDAVFDMYRQLDQPKGESVGLGIGLTLAQQLARMHGGETEALSDGPGTGAEFRLRLPIVVEASEQPPDMPEKDADVTAARRRVLVVDDNRAGADILRRVLSHQHVDARAAYGGAAAIAEAADFRPHVVFLDLGMPDMDGYETARRIRQEPWGREVVLVALTGWGQAEDRRRSRDAGFDRHLVKPATAASLRAVLDEIGPATGSSDGMDATDRTGESTLETESSGDAHG